MGPPAVVTSTLAVPAIPAGVVAVIEVSLTTVTLVAAGGLDRIAVGVFETATNRPLP